MAEDDGTFPLSLRASWTGEVDGLGSGGGLEGEKREMRLVQEENAAEMAAGGESAQAEGGGTERGGDRATAVQ